MSGTVIATVCGYYPFDFGMSGKKHKNNNRNNKAGSPRIPRIPPDPPGSPKGIRPLSADPPYVYALAAFRWTLINIILLKETTLQGCPGKGKERRARKPATRRYRHETIRH